MEPIRILIVDDEPAARSGIRHLLKVDPEVSVVAECRNGREAVEALRSNGADVVFLDVQMPELDGFGVVREVGPVDMPVVVFVTAYDQYALRAFEVHALDYLLKPFTDERFYEALSRAKEHLRLGRLRELSHRLADLLEGGEATAPGGASRYLRRLVIKAGGRITLLPVRDVEWIEAERDYVRLHVGKTSHVIRDTMKALEAQLDPTRFVRIHRSVIVNIERVKELQPMFKGEYVAVLFDGTELKLSRGYRDHLEAMLGRRL